MRLGEYIGFTVTPDGVQTLVNDVIDESQTSEVHAAYAQLAPAADACAEGVDIYCVATPTFELTIRLDSILVYAAGIVRIAAGYSVTPRGQPSQASRWLVRFSSPNDPIAVILYRILREICGCRDGELTDVYYPDPHYWNED